MIDFGGHVAETLRRIAAEEAYLADARRRAEGLAAAEIPDFSRADFEEFMREPYVLLPKKGAEWFCAVPRFVKFSVGWLERATKSYNVFLINRYTLWLGDVPEEFRRATGLEAPPGDLHLVDGKLLFGEGERPVAERYKGFLSQLGAKAGHVKRGSEFQLLAQLVSDGYLPFAPRPVAAADYREPEVKFSFEGKYEFQREAYERFMDTGAIGVYWMTSAGKSFVAMKALDSIKGKKLIVVPTRTLVDQWAGYLREHAPRLSSEYASYYNKQLHVVTYNAYEKVRNEDWQMVLFDECHRLPANSFAKLATLRTKYRMGLSASPYREDGRTNFIIALTGYPVGQDWQSLVKILGKDFHTVDVHIVTNEAAKLPKVRELFRPGVKTLIFSDSIELGARISSQLKLPHIHGGTSKRLEAVSGATAFVASRVLDEGVSIKDLEHIIEADFLFGSRRQEVQRTGRLLHSENPEHARHDVIMTREEFDSYGKRLHGLVERGFKVNVHH